MIYIIITLIFLFSQFVVVGISRYMGMLTAKINFRKALRYIFSLKHQELEKMLLGGGASQKEADRNEGYLECMHDILKLLDNKSEKY